MHLVAPDIEQYIEQHTTDEQPVLAALNRKTHTDVLMPQMLSGKVQGQFLQILSHMLRPRRVLEIGTFTGYAAICLAAGLQDDGKLYTIDINEELEPMVKDHLLAAGLQEKIFGNKEAAMNYYKEIYTNYPGSIYAVDARRQYRLLRGDQNP